MFGCLASTLRYSITASVQGRRLRGVRPSDVLEVPLRGCRFIPPSFAKYLHEFCKCYEAPSTGPGLKILDFGAGPIIANVISASLYASEIVLSDYLESNRKVLQMWLDRDPKAPNWSPFFQYVVQELEGRSMVEAAKREEELRQVIEAVIPCDIHNDPPVEQAYHMISYFLVIA